MPEAVKVVLPLLWEWYNIPNIHSDMTKYAIGVTLLMNTSEVRIYLGTNTVLTKCYITLRYTKSSS